MALMKTSSMLLSIKIRIKYQLDVMTARKYVSILSGLMNIKIEKGWAQLTAFLQIQGL